MIFFYHHELDVLWLDRIKSIIASSASIHQSNKSTDFFSGPHVQTPLLINEDLLVYFLIERYCLYMHWINSKFIRKTNEVIMQSETDLTIRENVSLWYISSC